MNPHSIFRFKQFSVSHHRSTMKVGTDAVILGAWTPVDNCRRILDVGTGCGIIALMLAQRSDAEITAIDIDEESIEEAMDNFRNNHWNTQLNAVHTSLRHYCESVQTKFDLVISNPPFFQNSLLPNSHKSKLARHTVSLTFDELARDSCRLLGDHGRLVIILPIAEKDNYLFSGLRYGMYLSGKLEVFPGTGKPAKRMILEFTLDKPALVKSHALTVRNADGFYSDEYKKMTKAFHPDIYFK